MPAPVDCCWRSPVEEVSPVVSTEFCAAGSARSESVKMRKKEVMWCFMERVNGESGLGSRKGEELELDSGDDEIFGKWGGWGTCADHSVADGVSVADPFGLSNSRGVRFDLDEGELVGE